LASEELADANKYLVEVTVTGATADAAGLVTVNFTVMNGTIPVTGITAVSASISKLSPPGGGLSYNRWVPYIYRPGRTVNAGYRESTTTTPIHGTLVNNGGGSYTYTFGTNLSTAAFAFPINNVSLVGYERNRTHRVSVYMGGYNGPTGEGDFDFVPDGSAVTATRNIVETATCKKCHGPEFHGHGGDRVTVEGCNTCHSPNSAMVNTAANGGTTESIEMAVMIHKIHAGRELASSKGADGQFYDNPWTPLVETDDNYHIGTVPYSYTVGNINATWRTAAFPAVLENCQACHTGSGLQNVDNWKTVPSRAACGSCHDTIDWAAGTNHSPLSIPQADDVNCSLCHSATLITTAHDWTTKDIRNIPEFNIALTVNTPSRGYFIKGESPVISIALTDKATGAVIPPSSVVQDPTGEGCIPLTGSEGTQCTGSADTLFTAASVYVTGPRAQRIPALTYSARAKVTSAAVPVGGWDLTALAASARALTVKVDSGVAMLAYNDVSEYDGYGADELISGTFTVTLPAAVLTVDNVVAALNADPVFKERAIAYVDEALAGSTNAGRLSIRSRGILQMGLTGNVAKTTAQPNIQIVSSPAGMFTDFEVKRAGSAATVRIQTVAANTDPKADFSDSTAIRYTLDPVDDLVPGTYVINVEYGNRGRGPNFANGGINPPEPPYVDYRTPSVAVATFQVKQADVEKPIADGCQNCHWSSAGRGFVLDNPRHNKPFKEGAVDQCGGCHDYLSAQNPATTTPASFGGGHPISKRVHAVHNGSALNYPTITVGHEETSAFGRNWRITYPMDIRNCESCHPASTTSGSWKTNPNRLACMGCHDSDAATAHMKINTYDPTPLAPWSGDEQESCKACH
jgi:OmcA/MtrC family decaheme c-type cytochrome